LKKLVNISDEDKLDVNEIINKIQKNELYNSNVKLNIVNLFSFYYFIKIILNIFFIFYFKGKKYYYSTK
jgi:hypothetical protein